MTVTLASSLTASMVRGGSVWINVDQGSPLDPVVTATANASGVAPSVTVPGVLAGEVVQDLLSNAASTLQTPGPGNSCAGVSARLPPSMWPDRATTQPV